MPVFVELSRTAAPMPRLAPCDERDLAFEHHRTSSSGGQGESAKATVPPGVGAAPGGT